MSVNARRGVKIAAGDVAWQVDALIERLQTLKERAVEGNLKSYDRPDTGAVDRAVDALNAALRERDAIAATIAAMGGAK